MLIFSVHNYAKMKFNCAILTLLKTIKLEILSNNNNGVRKLTLKTINGD